MQLKNILEIGTWKGYSAEVWIKAFKPKIFITLEKTYEQIEHFIQDTLETETHYLQIDSHIAAEPVEIELKGNPIDFLFIDGDHTLEGVTKDWEIYGPLVRKGGIIVFHDICYHTDGLSEVDMFWNDIKKNHKYVEIKVGPNSTGMGIIFV